MRFLSPRVEIWAEGNGVPGLQTEECRVGTEEYRADNKLHTIPERDLGLIGICNFLVVHQCV